MMIHFSARHVTYTKHTLVLLTSFCFALLKRQGCGTRPRPPPRPDSRRDCRWRPWWCRARCGSEPRPRKPRTGQPGRIHCQNYKTVHVVIVRLNSLTVPDISNEDVLAVAADWDGEGTAAVALAAVLAGLPARAQHLLRDPAPHGGSADGVGHYRHLNLQQLARGGATVRGGAPTYGIILFS